MNKVQKDRKKEKRKRKRERKGELQSLNHPMEIQLFRIGSPVPLFTLQNKVSPVVYDS